MMEVKNIICFSSGNIVEIQIEVVATFPPFSS